MASVQGWKVLTGARWEPDELVQVEREREELELVEQADDFSALATLARARRIARENGLRYVYTGNVRDEEGSSTYCPGCGTLVIGRDGYELTRWHLTGNGHCESCGAAIAGVFDKRPGRWGSRRLPVRLADFAA